MIREISAKGKTVFIVYSNQKEAGMVADVHALKEQILKRNSPVLLLSVFNEKVIRHTKIYESSRAGYP